MNLIIKKIEINKITLFRTRRPCRRMKLMLFLFDNFNINLHTGEETSMTQNEFQRIQDKALDMARDAKDPLYYEYCDTISLRDNLREKMRIKYSGKSGERYES